MERFDLGELRIDVVKKDIKNLHLSVNPPLGAVRISAPLYMQLDTIRVFAISKLAWIKSQQRKIQAQDRESPREYLNRESHYVWGKRYLLKAVHESAVPSVRLTHSQLVLVQRNTMTEAQQHTLLEAWYREQIRLAVPALLDKWQPVLGVTVARVFVQRMRTRWGSCNPVAKSIRLNTDLAKKPPACLEYILVHELMHLLEPTHNARFVALMELHLPKWRQLKAELNQLPVRHEDWEY
jgi:predicted metal-dependent hydrolase